MNEQQQIDAAVALAEKVKGVMGRIEKDTDMQANFLADPLAVFKDQGIHLPEEHQKEFIAFHRKASAANGFWCGACKTAVYYVVLAIGLTAVVALAAAIATYFNVAVAVAKEALALLITTTVTAAALASGLCAYKALNGPCA